MFGNNVSIFLDHIDQLGVDGMVQQTALTFIQSRANLLILFQKKRVRNLNS